MKLNKTEAEALVQAIYTLADEIGRLRLTVENQRKVKAKVKPNEKGK